MPTIIDDLQARKALKTVQIQARQQMAAGPLPPGRDQRRERHVVV